MLRLMGLRTELRAWVGGHLTRTVLLLGRRALGARVETHRDARGRETPVLVVGQARRGTIVWLHGFGDRVETFLPVAAKLRRDYRIVIPAMPAFNGGWVDREASHTFEAYGEWLAEVIAAVVPGDFHLMGNSLGGATALALAARMPERVSSLTLVCCAGVNVDGVRHVGHEIVGGDNLFEVRARADHERFMRRVMVRPPLLLRLASEHLFREQRGLADWYVRVANDLAEGGRGAFGSTAAIVELAAVRVPTLVVWGEHDSLLPLSIGEHVARTIPGAELEILHGIGHVPHVESPAALAKAFTRFARRVGAARASAP